MCGISVLIGLSNNNMAPYIVQMNSHINHRGPDDEGYALINMSNNNIEFYGGDDTKKDCYFSEVPYAPKEIIPNNENLPFADIAFAHRRLSIVDLSTNGHQPMSTNRQQHTIVFNGEIYNYRELRANLEKKGYKFISASDTEVILASYREWGIECLNNFNGMFSFVLYDALNKSIFSARDRFGIKPFYYWFSPTGFLAIASEIKQFTLLPGWDPRLNKQRAYDFFNWTLSDHTEETLFQGVMQLRGGHFIYSELAKLTNNLSPKKWYNLKASPVNKNLDEATEKFKELFNDSIELRMRADVPIGTALSGGLDSSSIVCTVDQKLKSKGIHDLLNTFSACSKYEKFDERKFIDEVTKLTCVDAHYTYPSHENLFEESRKTTWFQDEPYHSTSIFAEWNVFKLVSQTNVKVTLDGHGADELLAGYHHFFDTYIFYLMRKMKFGNLYTELNQLNNVHGYNGVSAIKYMVNMMLPNPLRQFLRKRAGVPTTEPSWINVKELGINKHYPAHILGNKSKSIVEKSVTQLLYSSVPVQLHWADRDSMAHSIESRLPFLDYRVVEFLLGCPENFKINNGMTKHILRKSMRGVLPDKITDRVDKMGFVTPEELWARKENPKEFMHRIENAVRNSHGLLNSNAVTKCQRIINGQEAYSSLPWRIINFSDWIDIFKVNG